MVVALCELNSVQTLLWRGRNIMKDVGLVGEVAIC